MENQTQILIDLWYSTSFGEKDTFDVNNRRLDHYKNTTVTPKIKNDKIHEGEKFQISTSTPAGLDLLTLVSCLFEDHSILIRYYIFLLYFFINFDLNKY